MQKKYINLTQQAMDEVEKSGNRNTFTTLMDEARKIAENYHVRLSIKTKEIH